MVIGKADAVLRRAPTAAKTLLYAINGGVDETENPVGRNRAVNG